MTDINSLAAESVDRGRWLASDVGKLGEAIEAVMAPCVKWAQPLRREIEGDPVLKATLDEVSERETRLRVQVVEDEGRWMTGGTVAGFVRGMAEELGLALGGRMAWGVLGR